MAGLDTYFGNPVSSHADRKLDLIGLGRLFAMSRQPDLNTLAAMKYQNEFGKTRVFTLRNAEEKDSSDKSRLVKSLRVPRLFGEDASVQKLSSLLAQGHEIKATRLSEEYDLEAFLERNRDNQTILLFAIDPKGRLRAYTDTFEPAVDEGWTLIHFGPAKERNPNDSPDK